jgi:hypothetical protein
LATEHHVVIVIGSVTYLNDRMQLTVKEHLGAYWSFINLVKLKGFISNGFSTIYYGVGLLDQSYFEGIAEDGLNGGYFSQLHC